MVYGLGGGAFASNKYWQPLLVQTGATTNLSASFSNTDAPIGWTFGGGASLMLGLNWDFFVEYDYMGFGGRAIEMDESDQYSGDNQCHSANTDSSGRV